jgi:hypothetical protein
VTSVNITTNKEKPWKTHERGWEVYVSTSTTFSDTDSEGRGRYSAATFLHHSVLMRSPQMIFDQSRKVVPPLTHLSGKSLI